MNECLKNLHVDYTLRGEGMLQRRAAVLLTILLLPLMEGAFFPRPTDLSRQQSMTAKERSLKSSGTRPYRDTPRSLTTATGGIRFLKMIGMMIGVRMATVPNQPNRMRRLTIQRCRLKNHGCISLITPQFLWTGLPQTLQQPC